MQNKGCWECAQFRHMKEDCHNKVSSSKGFESDANVVSNITEEGRVRSIVGELVES